MLRKKRPGTERRGCTDQQWRSFLPHFQRFLWAIQVDFGKKTGESQKNVKTIPTFKPDCVNLKQLAAILLSAMLLFNWYAFQPLMHLLDHRADTQMADRLDNLDYNASSLLEIIVPTSLPYTNNWSEFERANGSFEFNGQQYNYVMRKIVDGKMIYKCIPNEKKDHISRARNKFLALTFDVRNLDDSQKQGSGKSISFKKSMDDYIDQVSNISMSRFQIQLSLFTPDAAPVCTGFDFLPYEPPRA